MCRASGSNPTSRRTCFTPPARPASRRACSAMSAAMRWRWRHRWSTSSRASPATRMFTASDVGWVVGHSYIVYAPLIAGLTTVMYEGTPIRPDGGIWWRIVEKYRDQPDVHRADRDSRAEKAGPAADAAGRPVEPARAVPGRRTARRTHRAMDSERAEKARHRQLLADRNRLADDRDSARHRGVAAEARFARRAVDGLRPHAAQ